MKSLQDRVLSALEKMAEGQATVTSSLAELWEHVQDVKDLDFLHGALTDLRDEGRIRTLYMEGHGAFSVTLR